jgi:hypothetical protein
MQTLLNDLAFASAVKRKNRFYISCSDAFGAASELGSIEGEHADKRNLRGLLGGEVSAHAEDGEASGAAEGSTDNLACV